MKKVLIVFGTRPEAIKMAPLIAEFKKREESFETRVCITAQHREMLDQVLDFFKIKADYDLNLMKKNQTLSSVTAEMISSLDNVLLDYKPDFMFVHGDTSTTMSAALSGFYHKVKICHVEAGLRTNNKLSPYPEEINRQITSRIADLHFAPTEKSKQNLIDENIEPSDIFVTGNTVIDALLYSKERIKNLVDEEIDGLKKFIDKNKKIILVTGHRRENHGQNFKEICEALKYLALNNKDVQIVYPVHLNPNVQKPVYEILNNISNIHLINPLSYPAFIWLMDVSYLIITDSGGIQEEAPSLGKPVLVMRDTTERPEAVAVGTVKLVGAKKEKIISEVQVLLNDEMKYVEVSQLKNPYGNGTSSQQIVNTMEKL